MGGGIIQLVAIGAQDKNWKAKQIDQSLSVIELAKILGEQWMKLPEKEKDYYRNCYFCEREEVESKLGKG